METYFVYILYSESTDSFYKGQTNDIAYRLNQHNSGYEQSTKSGRPWRLIWKAEKENRSESLKFESKLKNLSRQRLIQFMLKYEQEVAGPDELLFLKQLSGC